MSNPKEPFYFECEYRKGIKFYQRHYFAHWNGEKIIGESRHRNLYLPYVAQRIKDTNPQARIIILLREPIARAYSHWWHWYYRSYERDRFKDAILKNLQRLESSDVNKNQIEEYYCKNLKKHGGNAITSYVDSGHYYDQIKIYFNLFPANQIKVIRSEDLKVNRKEIVESILDFLGLDSTSIDQINLERRHNKHVAKRKFPNWVYKVLGPTGLLKVSFAKKIGKSIRSGIYKDYQIDPEILDVLKDHYTSHNKRLEEFLKIDLSDWNDVKLN